jgi:hypothetical protein
MNTLNALRIAVACAAAFFAGLAFADSTTDQAQGNPPPAQDVGGVPMQTSASGAPMSITRAQVYQDLVRSEQTGQRAELQKDLYHGQ